MFLEKWNKRQKMIASCIWVVADGRSWTELNWMNLTVDACATRQVARQEACDHSRLNRNLWNLLSPCLPNEISPGWRRKPQQKISSWRRMYVNINVDADFLGVCLTNKKRMIAVPINQCLFSCFEVIPCHGFTNKTFFFFAGKAGDLGKGCFKAAAGH